MAKPTPKPAEKSAEPAQVNLPQVIPATGKQDLPRKSLVTPSEEILSIFGVQRVPAE